MKKSVFISVPATSGNLGPGFDVLGMALELRNKLHVRVRDTIMHQPIIRIFGEGAGTLPRDKRNVIYQTFEAVFKKVKKPIPSCEFHCWNNIPLVRGLGSSSAAIVSGLLAANALLGQKLDIDEILAMATKIEGHPDNVVPAILGGIQASKVSGERVITTSYPNPSVEVVVAVPDFQLSTKKARAILPKKIPMSDVINNLSAVALMGQALKNDLGLLKDLLNDRLHEPYRAKLIPGFNKVKEAALNAGAFGVILSGAGPTILSFVNHSKRNKVGQVMKKKFAEARVSCQIMNLKISQKGATVK